MLEENVIVAENIFQTGLEMLATGRPAAVATVLTASGFVPIKANGKFFMTSAEKLSGLGSSPALAEEIWAEAQRVMAENQRCLRQFSVTAPDAASNGWYREWTVELLIEPLTAQSQEILHTLVDLEETGHRGTLVTMLTDHPRYPTGRHQFLVCDDETTVGSLNDAALEAFVTRRGGEVLQGGQHTIEDYQTVEGETLRLLFEPILPTPTISIFGCGQVAFPLVRMAVFSGFKVRVIDTGTAFANKARFPEADATLVMAFDRVKEAFDFGPDDYVVLMTRGHQHDQQLLEQLYDCSARYLGMLGSKGRITNMWQTLEARGIDRTYLDRVRAPIGLNIRARSPEEISISIMAEIIQVRNTDPVEDFPRRPRRRHEQRTTTSVVCSP
jgi:xanthine dehydrogenase accessory factor